MYIKCEVLAGLLLVQAWRLQDLQPAGSPRIQGVMVAGLRLPAGWIIVMHGQGAGLGVHFM